MTKTEATLTTTFATYILVVGTICAIGAMLGCATVPQDVIDAITNAIPGAASNAVPDGGSVPTTTTTTTTTTVPPANPHAMTLKVTKLTTKNVSFDWQPRPYNWPSQTVKVEVDAVVSMFRANGDGGKFDWIRKGGQATKGLVNIHDGYGVWTTVGLPAPGEAVTFRWESTDGKQRSNDAAAVWPARSWWRFWE